MDPDEEVTIETPQGKIPWAEFLKQLTGSWFDHPDCRVPVDDDEPANVARETQGQ